MLFVSQSGPVVVDVLIHKRLQTRSSYCHRTPPERASGYVDQHVQSLSTGKPYIVHLRCGTGSADIIPNALLRMPSSHDLCRETFDKDYLRTPVKSCRFTFQSCLGRLCFCSGIPNLMLHWHLSPFIIPPAPAKYCREPRSICCGLIILRFLPPLRGLYTC